MVLQRFSMDFNNWIEGRLVSDVTRPSSSYSRACSSKSVRYLGRFTLLSTRQTKGRGV